MISIIDAESLIKAVEKTPNQDYLPEQISRLIFSNTSIVLDLLPIFFRKKLSESKTKAALRLISACFEQIRYRLDDKSTAANELFNKVQALLKELYAEPSGIEKSSEINRIIYENKLDFIIDLDEADKDESFSDRPSYFSEDEFIDLLERIRIGSRIRSAFDFYEVLMSQIQIAPIQKRLEIIRHLTITKKQIPHEVAVLMLLQPKHEDRRLIIKLFLGLVDKKVFTSLDLRRLMMIESWLPEDECGSVGELIQKIREQGVRPHPYPISKVDKIIASEFDGAGAQMILFKLKHQGHHVVGGFVAKQGIGIREPWVETKATKEQLDNIYQEAEMPLKAVTLAYVNRVVSHFLSEGHVIGNVPSPLLLQLTEILGASDWKAKPICIEEEIKRISQKSDFDLKDKTEIRRSLDRTKDWNRTKSFMRTWFECGERAENAIQEAEKKHKKLSKKGESSSMKNIFIEELVFKNIEKWKVLMLFMCFWARSKEIEEPLWKDLLISLDQIVSGDTKLEDIPIIEHIAGQTIAAVSGAEGIDAFF